MSHAPTESASYDRIDERRAEVLRAIVEEYVASAQPVASQRVVARKGLTVSSATVRNDMNSLERDGYIAQPHTSAGRVPTDRGYRYYVDHLAASAGLERAQQRAVSDFFEAAHRAMEDVLSQTSHLLARITNHAAVVVTPQGEAPTLRGVQLVDIGDGSVLMVLVTSTGSVQRVPLTGPAAEHASPELLARASTALTAATLGTPMGRAATWTRTGDAELDALAASAMSLLSADDGARSSSELFVGGASRIAQEAGFNDASTVRDLLELLEHQYLVVSLARELMSDGVNVRIGAENREVALRDCSLVIAPYRIDGRGVGTVAILGPTRMDYPGAIAAVDTVSRRLESHLSS